MIFLFFTRWGEGGGEGGRCRYCEICLTGYATDNNQNEKYDAHATCQVPLKYRGTTNLDEPKENWGTYKVRNEIETKRNQQKQNEIKRNQRNQRKQNEID